MATETTFPAMGTSAQVLVVDGPAGAGAWARARIEQLEALWSRFLPDSEVSAMNAADGDPVEVSGDTLRLLHAAIDGWELSGGLFDPTTLPALEAAGYDRTFAAIDERIETRPAVGAPGCGDIELDLERGRARLPRGVRFDPGGIGKGLAADLVAEQLLDAGARGVLVNLGGDLVARGQAPGGAGWTIEITEPTALATPVARIAFAEGAVATSVVTKRRWDTDDGPRHHVIDPATGRSLESPVVLSSVLASSGWIAEVAATWRLAASASTSVLADLPAITVDGDGTRELHGGMEAYLS